MSRWPHTKDGAQQQRCTVLRRETTCPQREEPDDLFLYPVLLPVNSRERIRVGRRGWNPTTLAPLLLLLTMVPLLSLWLWLPKLPRLLWLGNRRRNPRAANVAGFLAAALDHLHRRGVTHCHVKLENVFIRDRTVKLKDLGPATFDALAFRRRFPSHSNLGSFRRLSSHSHSDKRGTIVSSRSIKGGRVVGFYPLRPIR